MIEKKRVVNATTRENYASRGGDDVWKDETYYGINIAVRQGIMFDIDCSLFHFFARLMD